MNDLILVIMATKKTAVTDTSKQAYAAIVREGLIEKEKAQVFKIMSGMPEKALTSRALMNITNKERGNITRVLYDLVKAKKIEISHKAKCPETKRTVQYYKLSQTE